MKIVAPALSAAVLIAGFAFASKAASAMTARGPAHVGSPVIEASVKVCKTRTVKHYHRAWPHNPYYVKVRTCYWL
jgi:hypothetical protein